MALTGERKETPGIGMLAFFVFFLTAAPKINIKIGPVPIYFVDILIVFLVIATPHDSVFKEGRRPFRSIVSILLVFAIAGEFASYAYSGEIVQPTYLIARTILAFVVFYLTGQLIRGPRDLELVIKAAVLGLIVTSSLMILSSLPMTRSIVTELVFSNKFLEPASETVYRKFSVINETGVRGQTLVGVSIMGATYVNILWPLAALLFIWPFEIGRWRQVAFFGCLIAPFAVLMSYSRGPILGAILLLLLAIVFGMRRLKRGFVIPLVVSAILISTVGVGSSIFFFERLENRFLATVNAPFENERETARILSYVEPFAHVIENPQYFLFGEGNAIKKTTVRYEQAGKATHSLFSAAYYANGLVAAILYLFLVVSMIYFAYWHVSNRRGTLDVAYAQALLGSVVAILPWAVFGHTIVSAPRGAMMFFFMLGMLASLRNFPVR